jgi:hypothetical protein
MFDVLLVIDVYPSLDSDKHNFATKALNDKVVVPRANGRQTASMNHNHTEANGVAFDIDG